MKKELYFSADVETDGPIPGTYSMLSFGVVALTEEGNIVDTFEANLETIPGAKQDPGTMSWWQNQPKAWEQCRKDLQNPTYAMGEFVHWVERTCGDRYKPVMVCMPAGFDFMFLYWYMINFAGRSPFSFSCIDMKTYAMAMRKTDYRKSGKSYWPPRWFSKQPHTHIALDDAKEQGYSFIQMLKENTQK
jgi:hypothetical protein